MRPFPRMSRWTATAKAKATPEQLLEVLTHPEEIRALVAGRLSRG